MVRMSQSARLVEGCALTGRGVGCRPAAPGDALFGAVGTESVSTQLRRSRFVDPLHRFSRRNPRAKVLQGEADDVGLGGCTEAEAERGQKLDFTRCEA